MALSGLGPSLSGAFLNVQRALLERKLQQEDLDRRRQEALADREAQRATQFEDWMRRQQYGERQSAAEQAAQAEQVARDEPRRLAQWRMTNYWPKFSREQILADPGLRAAFLQDNQALGGLVPTTAVPTTITVPGQRTEEGGLSRFLAPVGTQSVLTGETTTQPVLPEGPPPRPERQATPTELLNIQKYTDKERQSGFQRSLQQLRGKMLTYVRDGDLAGARRVAAAIDQIAGETGTSGVAEFSAAKAQVEKEKRSAAGRTLRGGVGGARPVSAPAVSFGPLPATSAETEREIEATKRMLNRASPKQYERINARLSALESRLRKFQGSKQYQRQRDVPARTEEVRRPIKAISEEQVQKYADEQKISLAEAKVRFVQEGYRIIK